MAHPFYKTKAWRLLRAAILERDKHRCQWPGCGVGLCGGRKHKRSAVVDHKQPHRGDRSLFFASGNLWSLCKRCHDSPKQALEKRGYSKAIGPDGWPIDKAHPVNDKDNRNT